LKFLKFSVAVCYRKNISAAFGYRNSLWVFLLMISTTVHFCFAWVCMLICFILVNNLWSFENKISKKTSHKTCWRQRDFWPFGTCPLLENVFYSLTYESCLYGHIYGYTKLSIFEYLPWSNYCWSFNISSFHNIFICFMIYPRLWLKPRYIRFMIYIYTAFRIIDVYFISFFFLRPL